MDKFSIEECERLLKDLEEFSIEMYWNDMPIRKDLEEATLVDNISKKFFIPKAEVPVYLKVTHVSEIDYFNKRILKALDKLKIDIDKEIKRAEGRVQEGTEEALNGIYRVITNCIKVSDKHLKKVNNEEGITITELREQYKESISKLIESRIIKPIIPSIYEGMKTGEREAYTKLLKHINEFLASIGIYTYKVEIGEEVDYDYVEPVSNDKDITEDTKLEGKVREITRYPYIFSKESIVSEGQVVIWRSK